MPMDPAIFLERVRKELEKYAPIPDDEWERTDRTAFTPVRYEKGEHFLRIGDVPDKMGFIWSGLFRIFCITEQGDERIMAFRGENRFLSAFSPFLESQPSWYGIQALEPSILLCFDLQQYQRLMAGHPCWCQISRKYVENLFIEKERRERDFLTENAETRYLNFLREYPDLEDRAPQYQVASYLGITPVALSRIRKALRNKNQIS